MDDNQFRKLLEYLDYSWRGYRKVRKGVKKRIRRHMHQIYCRDISDYLKVLDRDPVRRQECELLMTYVSYLLLGTAESNVPIGSGGTGGIPAGRAQIRGVVEPPSTTQHPELISVIRRRDGITRIGEITWVGCPLPDVARHIEHPVRASPFAVAAHSHGVAQTSRFPC